MNFYDEKIGTPFLFWRDIAKVLSSFEKRRYSNAYHVCYFSEHFKKFAA
jgi:hypothetical protein